MKEKVRKSILAMRALGVPDEKGKQVLKQLLKVYENWEFIEAENYRLLIDACFDPEYSKEVEHKGSSKGNDKGGSKENDEYERPSKKLQTRQQGDSVPSSVDKPKQTLPSRNTHQMVESSQSLVKRRQIESNSPLQSTDSGERGKDLVLQIKSEFDNPVLIMRDDANCSGSSNASNLISARKQSVSNDKKRKSNHIIDITKGTEKVKISMVDDTGSGDLPTFTYIPQNIVYQNAYVPISLARISDEDCCSSCKGNCLSSSVPCACARETGGEFAYTRHGVLKEEFLETCMSMKEEPDKYPLFYCQDCPWEKTKNELMPESCGGHLIRKFIKECWRKCGCDMHCGNRVVQRGITCKLQVFWTQEGKGWGVRALEDLRKGSFVCEYVGEILTNTELYDRNVQSTGSERHTYPVTLDSDWGSEKILRDEEALCLDATLCGNVARFINHRCVDANLIDIPVEVETPDRHYYHVAFFTTRKVRAHEELTWDYCIDFSNHEHPIKAFQCNCGSEFCRDVL